MNAFCCFGIIEKACVWSMKDEANDKIIAINFMIFLRVLSKGFGWGFIVLIIRVVSSLK